MYLRLAMFWVNMVSDIRSRARYFLGYALFQFTVFTLSRAVKKIMSFVFYLVEIVCQARKYAKIGKCGDCVLHKTALVLEN